MKAAFVVQQLGQSIWMDNIQRGQLTGGEFKLLIEEEGITGVTSNPTIFEKAISGSEDYDEGLRALIGEGAGPEEIFDALAVEDLRAAADALRTVYDRTEGADGFVSIEVAPGLAHDTEGTIAAGRRLWAALDRPNVMVKIPGTKAGLPAIEQCLSEGININITLLFSVERYLEVVERYFAALERRAAAGEPVDRIASVASFFVSRVDTAVDRAIDARLAAGDPEAERLRSLRGTIAIANAKLAYQRFQERFAGGRWERLAAAGARVQRPLWASTGTKDPAYSDVYYVEALIGPHTVDTLPPATLEAFNDHGKVALTLAEGVEEAVRDLEQLATVGIDLDDITETLEREGVESFAKSFESLMAGIAAKRDAILEQRPVRESAALGALRSPVAESLMELQGMQFGRRIWERDGSLWSDDPRDQALARERLGWLDSMTTMVEEVPPLDAFAAGLRADGFTDAVLMGMGGSSLAPEVLRDAFGSAEGALRLHVLDSTDPLAIRALDGALDGSHTLFIASSKTGTTTETMSFLEYYWARLEQPAQFAVITDAGTPMERLGRELGFRGVFLNREDIGGRYSAISMVGLVPGAILGLDLRRLLASAQAMADACGPAAPPDENLGVSLGAVIGRAARDGRNKLTILCSPSVAGLGNWIEQLIAESTGKQGRGIVPVVGEPAGPPGVYGEDRLFVYVSLDGDEDREQAEAVTALEAAGEPVVRIALRDRYELGGEFFRWEMATAAAGALLGVEVFDQPNVEESKENTRRLLREYEQAGALPADRPLFDDDGLTLFAAAPTAGALRKAGDAVEALRRFVGECQPGDYLAIMAYLPPREPVIEALQAIRVMLRDRLKVATTLGFGPRFLHSTGQLHKGGPPQGVFLQIASMTKVEIPIPGVEYGFATLEQAQALGDLQALQSRRLRVLRVDLEDMISGLPKLAAALASED